MTQTAEKAVEQLKTLTLQAAQLIQQIQQVEETLAFELNIEGDILTASSKLVKAGDLAVDLKDLVKDISSELELEKAEFNVVSEDFDISEIRSEIDDILTQMISADTRIEADQANVNSLKIETKEILADLQIIIDACGKNYTNSENSF